MVCQSDAGVLVEGGILTTVGGSYMAAVLVVCRGSRRFFPGIGRWCAGRAAAWTSADVGALLSSRKLQTMHKLLP